MSARGRRLKTRFRRRYTPYTVYRELPGSEDKRLGRGSGWCVIGLDEARVVEDTL